MKSKAPQEWRRRQLSSAAGPAQKTEAATVSQAIALMGDLDRDAFVQAGATEALEVFSVGRTAENDSFVLRQSLTLFISVSINCLRRINPQEAISYQQIVEIITDS